MAAQTFTIFNNSSTAAIIRNFRFVAVGAGGIDHVADFTDWNNPWAVGTGEYTGDDTRLIEEVTYFDDFSPINRTFTSRSGNDLNINSTVKVFPGYTLQGNGYTAGQTVMSITSATQLVTSAGPNGTPIPGEAITFTTTTYRLLVLENSGITPGLEATSNGYTAGQTVISTSGTQWLIMSAPPNGVPGAGDITFRSNVDVMATIAPNNSKTFTLNYTNATTSVGSYLENVVIHIEQDGAKTETLNNLVLLSHTPVPNPVSPYYPGTPGGFDPGVTGITTGDIGVTGGTGGLDTSGIGGVGSVNFGQGVGFA